MESTAETDNKPEPQLAGIPIIVGERPMVFWDFDHASTQIRFLESLDPSYFTYLQQVHEEQLTGSNNLQAAVALRMAYSHALESLFALIGAAIQAPHCPAGWLLRYQNADLTLLINRITSRESFYNKLRIDRGNWDAVAARIFPWSLPDEAQVEHRTATARLWRALAIAFLDEHLQDEYNSLKHGLRVRSGGWYFAMGLEDYPGVPAPPERMRIMAQSEYGSSFLRSVWLKKHQYAVEEQRVNWNPSEFLGRLPLVVDSIGNVITFIKSVNGAPMTDVHVAAFNSEAVEKALSSDHHSSSFRFSTRSGIPVQVIDDATSQHILATYLSTDEENGSEGWQKRAQSETPSP